MRLLPKSLTGRLLVTAGVAIAVALVFAALTIGHVLERFVMHGLDDRLDAQIAVVARSARPDGTIDPALATDLPPYDRAGSGWAWQIITPTRTLRSASLGPADLPLPPGWDQPPRWDWAAHHHRHEGAPTRPRPLDGIDQSGQPVHYRILTLQTAAGPIDIVAAGPRDIVERPWRAAMTPLLVSLLLLGAFLALALLLQLRIGLRPLSRLTALLGEVREGRLSHVDVDEPTELLPLVEELNALIATNAQALARARGHVANLAHGLKTPLATLRLDLDHPQIDPEGRLAEQVMRMEGQIRHHLGRARAAEPGAAASTTVALRACVDDLAQAMGRIHADRAIVPQIDIAASVAIRCDPQDLDELLGNLLDNAWRWAHATVQIVADEEDRQVHIVIADDGPGMSDQEIGEALIRGRRLDERASGHGFGLSISRELVELHGGSLDLARSDLGGLEVRIRLPRIRDKAPAMRDEPDRASRDGPTRP
ncbi:sensor histidine kinase [Sphingomonas abietis]|uniref:histidine kinase n=1 Tax=Sphingomonas abietis TaxID=3012344 RepID=A0ABY7NSV7_9SPHN|nr:HAMP domain-containing sensor histidine kinase [Sphingomonas abietis]WBO23728.1 HAMP domain-containing sensor histidine kinase [Sphingomonas abietis]